jgi:outer membrane protein OmpA-like peptidoglycan-associated protein
MTVLLLAAVGGCAWLTGSQNYSVYFQPYSAELDPQAHATIHAAADFASSHKLQPIALNGFSAPPDPNQDIEGLSAQRAEAVKQALVAEGISPLRITTAANGIVDPKALPNLAVRRVDITVGQ